MHKETWILTSEELGNDFWTRRSEKINGHTDNLLEFINKNDINLSDKEGIYILARDIVLQGNLIMNFEDRMVVCFIPVEITKFQYDFLTKKEVRHYLKKTDLHVFSYYEENNKINIKFIEDTDDQEEPSPINRFYKDIKKKYKKNKQKIKR